jgi:hypothetical protein
MSAGGTPTGTRFHELATLSQQRFTGSVKFLPTALNRSRRHRELMVMAKGIGGSFCCMARGSAQHKKAAKAACGPSDPLTCHCNEAQVTTLDSS